MRGRRRGSQIIEFALLAPLLFGALGLVVDVGWYLRQDALVTEAVFVGVRAAMLQDDLPAEEAVERAALEQLALAGVHPVAVQVRRVPGALDAVEVVATAPFSPLFGIWPSPPEVRYSLVWRAS